MIRIGRLFLVVALIFAPFVALPVAAQDATACGSFGYSGLSTIGTQNLTVSTTVITLTIPANTVCANVWVNTESVRVSVGDTAPTSSLGGLMSAVSVIPVGTNDIKRFKMIRAGAADANVFVFYEGPPQ